MYECVNHCKSMNVCIVVGNFKQKWPLALEFRKQLVVGKGDATISWMTGLILLHSIVYLLKLTTGKLMQTPHPVVASHVC